MNSNDCAGGQCPINPSPGNTTGTNPGNTNNNNDTGSVFNVQVFDRPGWQILYFKQDGCAPCAEVEPVSQDFKQNYGGVLDIINISNFSRAKFDALGFVGTPSMAIGYKGQLQETYTGAAQIIAALQNQELINQIEQEQNIPVNTNVYSGFNRSAIIVGLIAAYLIFK